MLQKEPSSIDQHISNLIRLKRMQVGLSQQALADTLGVTFQQIQKYEKGINRVSVGRLFEISEALGVAPSYFFGLPEKETEHAGELMAELAASREAVKILRIFQQLPKNVRRTVISFAEGLIVR